MMPAMDPTREQDTETHLQELLDAWASAEQRGDAPFLDGWLADDFIGIGPRGFPLTKGDWLRRYTSGDLKLDAFSLDEVKLRVYGDAAVVICRQSQSGKFQDHNIQGLFRATLVLVRHPESWRLVSLHLCAMA
jgi:ketosteroid isomerase-like protein